MDRQITEQQTSIFSHVNPYCLVHQLLQNWYILVLAALIGAMSVYLWVGFVASSDYESGVTFSVTSKTTTKVQVDNNYGLNDEGTEITTVESRTNATAQTVKVFAQLLQTNVLKNKIAEEMGVDTLPGSLSCKAIDNTNLLAVTASADKPQDAFDIVQGVINNYRYVSEYLFENVVLDVLVSPQVPEHPSRLLPLAYSITLGAVLGLLLVALLICAITVLRNTVQSVSGARTQLDSRILAIIQHEVGVEEHKKQKHAEDGNKRGVLLNKELLIINPQVGFGFKETIKKIKTRLEYEQQMNGHHIFMLTSTVENEGKSTIALNLALALAKKTRKVLLIDLDLRSPTISKLLNIRPGSNQEVGRLLENGFSAEEFDKAIIYNQACNLYLLFGIRKYMKSADLLSGANVEKLFSQLQQFDYVIVDTPPLSYFSDSQSIASWVDASLLVVRQDRASAGLINNTIESLEESSSDYLGCILNDMRSLGNSESRYGANGGYGSYGKYGYGRNDKHANDKHKSAKQKK